MKRMLFWVLLGTNIAPLYAQGLFHSYVTDEQQGDASQPSATPPASTNNASDDDNAAAREFIERIRLLHERKISTIVITGISNSEQHNNAEVFLSLEGVKGKKITQPFYTNYLINNGANEIIRSQQPFGYYGVKVDVKREMEGSDGVKVTYAVTLGEPVKIHDVAVSLSGAGKTDADFTRVVRANPLHKGNVLRDARYEDYKTQFRNVALRKGYFDGTFTTNRIAVNPEEHRADITLNYDTGVRYKYGEIGFSNAEAGKPNDRFADAPNGLPLGNKLLYRYVKFKEGDDYEANALTTLQQNLQGSQYFRQVLVGGRPNRETKTVPVQSQLTMNKNKHYALGLGYSTDIGIYGKAAYDWRWANRRGHTFNSSLFLSQKNSLFDNVYKIPAKNPTTDYYYIRAGAWRKDDNYKSDRAFLEGGYAWRRGHMDYRASATTAYDKFTIGNDSDKVILTYPTLQAVYTSTTDRLNPPSGFQARANVSGAMENVLSDVSFVQTNVNLRYIQKINQKNRFITRFDTGADWTDNYHRLPPALRYFAGGDNSIRGYSYEKIGPRDSSGSNIGGKYLAVGSLEYEYYVKPTVALAAFVDGGDAFTNSFKPKYGAGVGVHWYSPVGPIRIDLGHGFDHDYGSTIRLHLSIGAELNL